MGTINLTCRFNCKSQNGCRIYKNTEYGLEVYKCEYFQKRMMKEKAKAERKAKNNKYPSV